MIGATDDPREPRRVGVPLMIGLVTVPLVFGWFLLRQGYANSTRAVVAVYALLGPALATMASTDRLGG